MIKALGAAAAAAGSEKPGRLAAAAATAPDLRKLRRENLGACIVKSLSCKIHLNYNSPGLKCNDRAATKL